MYPTFEVLKNATLALLLVCCLLLPRTNGMRAPHKDNPSIASQPGFVFDKDKLLDNFNDMRRKFAKKKNFANMFKLEWDDSLANKSKHIDYSGTFTSNRRQFDTPLNDGTLDHVENWYFQYLNDEKEEKKLQEYSLTSHLSYFEVLLPGQKHVGCAKIDVNYVGYVFNTLCFFTPEGDFKTYNSSIGEPGSDCPSDYHNDDGLCAPAPTTTSGSNLVIIGGCIAGAGVVLCIVVGIVVFCILKKKKKKQAGGSTTATGTATGTGATGTPGTGTTGTGTAGTGTNTGNPPVTTRY